MATADFAPVPAWPGLFIWHAGGYLLFGCALGARNFCLL
jgi:hypothetical protein